MRHKLNARIQLRKMPWKTSWKNARFAPTPLTVVSEIARDGARLDVKFPCDARDGLSLRRAAVLYLPRAEDVRFHCHDDMRESGNYLAWPLAGGLAIIML